jgi:hypothetical protein
MMASPLNAWFVEHTPRLKAGARRILVHALAERGIVSVQDLLRTSIPDDVCVPVHVQTVIDREREQAQLTASAATSAAASAAASVTTSAAVSIPASAATPETSPSSTTSTTRTTITTSDDSDPFASTARAIIAREYERAQSFAIDPPEHIFHCSPPERLRFLERPIVQRRNKMWIQLPPVDAKVTPCATYIDTVEGFDERGLFAATHVPTHTLIGEYACILIPRWQPLTTSQPGTHILVPNRHNIWRNSVITTGGGGRSRCAHFGPASRAHV